MKILKIEWCDEQLPDKENLFDEGHSIHYIYLLIIVYEKYELN